MVKIVSLNDQASGLRRMMRQRPVRVITISSGKGGVGKTNIAINLGMALRKKGLDVMIMDADLGLSNVDVMLGLAPRLNLAHVLNGEKSLDEVIIDGPEGLMVVPAASGAQMMASLTPTQHAAIIRAFSELNHNLDVLIVDNAAGISDSVVSFSKAAQEVIVTICDEPASITDAYALIKVLNKGHGLTRFRILANMVNSEEQGRHLYEKVARVTDQYLYVELDFMGIVPYDGMLRKAVQQQRPVVELAPQSPASMAFMQMAENIDKWPMPRSGGQLEFFAERLIQHGQAEHGVYV